MLTGLLEATVLTGSLEATVLIMTGSLEATVHVMTGSSAGESTAEGQGAIKGGGAVWVDGKITGVRIELLRRIEFAREAPRSQLTVGGERESTDSTDSGVHVEGACWHAAFTVSPTRGGGVSRGEATAVCVVADVVSRRRSNGGETEVHCDVDWEITDLPQPSALPKSLLNLRPIPPGTERPLPSVANPIATTSSSSRWTPTQSPAVRVASARHDKGEGTDSLDNPDFCG